MPLTLADFSDPFEPIYTFVERATGANVNIASARLCKWCEGAGLEIVGVLVDRVLAGSFVRDNIVAPKWCEHLLSLVEQGMKFPPVIFAKDGGETDGAPDVMLVDGHHRYFIAAMSGVRFIPSYVLEVEQWRPFEILGLRDTTAEALKRAPIMKELR
jgi:hypothetical protein